MKHFLGFLNTHPLWINKQFGLEQFEMPDIDFSNIQPKPIPTNLRLGHQVEYIFKQLVDYSGVYAVRAHNIQLKKRKETIGELDFILERLDAPDLSETRFRESDKHQYLHVELTYKFYVIDPSISEPIHRLMGPNRGDMFFTKMEKTRDRQLPLAFSPEGKRALATYEIDALQLEQQACFLGQLFIPYQIKPPSIRPLNTDCITGFWVSFEQFNSGEFKDYNFYIPFKYQWLHAPHLEVPWSDHFSILMEINMRHINERSPMVWIRKDDDTLEKCFVVWW